MNNVIYDKYFYYKPSPRLSNDVKEKLSEVGMIIKASVKHKQLQDTKKYGRDKWDKYSLAILKVQKDNSNNFDENELIQLVSYMADDDLICKGKTGIEIFNMLYELCCKYIKEFNVEID